MEEEVIVYKERERVAEEEGLKEEIPVAESSKDLQKQTTLFNEPYISKEALEKMQQERWQEHEDSLKRAIQDAKKVGCNYEDFRDARMTDEQIRRLGIFEERQKSSELEKTADEKADLQIETQTADRRAMNLVQSSLPSTFVMKDYTNEFRLIAEEKVGLSNVYDFAVKYVYERIKEASQQEIILSDLHSAHVKISIRGTSKSIARLDVDGGVEVPYANYVIRFQSLDAETAPLLEKIYDDFKEKSHYDDHISLDIKKYNYHLLKLKL